MTSAGLTPKFESDMEVDFIAVGSGMGASCAALAAQSQGLETVMLEKSEVFGGGTTYSYGIVWGGDNHLERALESKIPGKTPMLISTTWPPVTRWKATSGPTSRLPPRHSNSSATTLVFLSMWCAGFPIISRAWPTGPWAKAAICRSGPSSPSRWANGINTCGPRRRSRTGRPLKRLPVGADGRNRRTGTASSFVIAWSRTCALLGPALSGI
ncbi:MAG: hypothetical protein DSY79_10045 [Chloroflexi bacterium]|nr:MAG: hypothetical protein DSY79_10045 [Chloroflexota bacterium]